MRITFMTLRGNESTDVPRSVKHKVIFYANYNVEPPSVRHVFVNGQQPDHMVVESFFLPVPG